MCMPIFTLPFLSSSTGDLVDAIVGLSLAQPSKINLPFIRGPMTLPVIGPFITATVHVPIHGLSDPQVSISPTQPTEVDLPVILALGVLLDREVGHNSQQVGLMTHEPDLIIQDAVLDFRAEVDQVLDRGGRGEEDC